LQRKAKWLPRKSKSSFVADHLGDGEEDGKFTIFPNKTSFKKIY
jgi:hypothetical protein